jgi:hypothetical protein
MAQKDHVNAKCAPLQDSEQRSLLHRLDKYTFGELDRVSTAAAGLPLESLGEPQGERWYEC